MVLKSAAIAQSGIVLEMPHPGSTESETLGVRSSNLYFKQTLHVIPVKLV